MQPITVLSLFNGMSGGMLALNEAKIPVHKYYSSEIDKFANAESQANFPDIVQLGDVTKWKEWDIEWDKIDLLMGGFPCFPEGTMVLTSNGHKDIKDITIGDLVLTHTGNFREVISTGSKLAPTRIIKGQGHLDIECTDNHPFYARTMKSVWDNSKRQNVREFSPPEWVEAKDLTPEHFLTTTKHMNHNESIKNTNYWYFMGRFMGDGWISKVKRKNRKNSFTYRTFICCSHDEFDELVTCFDGLGMKYNYVKERTTYKFYICSQELLEFCSLMGSGASNKVVHPDLFMESVENQKAFIDGYFDADGHTDGEVTKFTTTSYQAVLGIQQLIMNVYGRHSNISKTVPSPTKLIEDREVNQKPYYVLSFQKDEPKKDEAYYDSEQYAWVKGSKSNVSTGEWKTVYNIEVAVDNTYTANNIVVHNCQAWSVAGKQGGTNDPRGMLFHTMVDIYHHIKALNPNLKVLFENVKMKEDFKQYIDGILGMTPKMINSQNYTAHYRQRYYWYSSDKYFIPPPIMSSPSLQSILDSDYTDREKSYCIDANYWKGGDPNQYFNKSRRQMVFMDPDIDREYLIEKGINKIDYRKLSVVECCRCQGVPDDYFKVSSNTQAYKMLGNGWTIPVIAHLLRDIFF